VREERIPELRERLKAWCGARLKAADLLPRLRVDVEIPLRTINRGFLEHLQRFAPFGPRNQQPQFLTRGALLKGQPRVVGNGHLLIRVEQDGVEYDAIGYGLGRLAEGLEAREDRVDIVYTIVENNWRGTSCIQLQLKDACPTGSRRAIPRRIARA
jgi:single-stranded-DNA-specific exonuclease